MQQLVSDGCPQVYTCNTSVVWAALALVSFQMQFKLLVATFKILYGTGPDYLWDCLSLKKSTLPNRSDMVGMLLIPSLKCYPLMGSRKHAYHMEYP